MLKHLADITVDGEQLALGVVGRYPNGRMAIGAEDKDGCAYGVLSVNLPNAELEKNEFCVKNWSESMEFADKAYATGLFSDTGKTIPTGWVKAPVWRLNIT